MQNILRQISQHKIFLAKLDNLEYTKDKLFNTEYSEQIRQC